MNAATFFDSLKSSRVLDEGNFARLRQRFDDSSPAEQIASSLVEDGTLTDFQLKHLLEADGQQLVLGQYRILSELGRGGFGKVYKARHVFMDRVVALKVISPALVEDERARNWFRREVLAATQFDHPNIVKAYDANEVDGQLFLVLEFVQGLDLEKLVHRQGPLPLGLANEIIRQAALALEHAHRKETVHRDIKPANLLIVDSPGKDSTRSAMVKMTDFGLSRLRPDASQQTLGGIRERGVVGTPGYISPEQARDIHSAGPKSDLYSLGCTWYYAVTGRAPFRGSAVEVIVQHLEKAPPTPDMFRPEIPRAVSDGILRLLAKDPADRFASATDLVHYIDSISTVSSVHPIVVVPDLLPSTPDSSECNTPTYAADESMDSAPSRDQATSHDREPAHDQSAGFSATSAPAASEIDKTDVKTEWRRWTKYLHSVENGRFISAVDERNYPSVHAALIGCSRALRQHADATTQQLLRLVEESVEPWVTLDSLRRIDRETRQSLIAKCEKLERTFPELQSRRGGIGILRILAIVIAACIVGVFWQQLQVRFVRAGSIAGLIKGDWAFVLSVAAGALAPIFSERLIARIRQE